MTTATVKPKGATVPGSSTAVPRDDAIATAATATAAAGAAGSGSTSKSYTSSSNVAVGRQPVPARNMAVADLLSDKATVLLIRRTLCPQEGAAAATATAHAGDQSQAATTPIEDLLPPLTSRNDVDLQLYALLAIVVREFVLTWYSKITPDEQFITEIIQIVAHCTRALEQRLRKVDLESLLFDELPELLNNHVSAYRASRSPMARPPVETDPRAVYHTLWPLPALSPVVPSRSSNGSDGSSDMDAISREKAVEEQAANEAAYRELLVQGVLAVLLPTEDLENDCLTPLVGQIFAELLIGNVLARRVAEPWMMWEIIGLLARLVRDKIDGDDNGKSGKGSLRGAKKKKTKADQQLGSTASPSPSPPPSGWLVSTAGPVFWSALKVGFALVASLRFLVTSIVLSRSLPLRNTSSSSGSRHLADDSSGSTSKGLASSSVSMLSFASGSAPTFEPVPVLAFSLWSTISNVAQLETRMPWLYGGLSMLHWLAMTGPGRVAALNGPLDRLLSHYLHKYALDPALLPILLRAVRGAVFPGNKFGATPPTLVAPANDDELRALKRRTAGAVYAVYHDKKPPSDAALQEIEGGLLNVFDDAYCNKHLLYGLLEAILVRLVPELAETGVLGLWEERLS